MKVDRRVAEQSLASKGFRRDPSGDHIFFYHEYNGKETGIKTYVSHAAKYRDIGPDNLKSMTKQLKLPATKRTRDLLECPMNEAEYNQCLIDSGFLSTED
ncbi:MAG: hypothetical protein ACLQPD_18045 [Desulfomonilaceae bacterium]